MALVTVFALTGCSPTVHEALSFRKVAAAKYGYVDISQVEAAEPEMPMLKAVDQQLSIASRFNTLTRSQAPDLNVGNYIKHVASIGTVDIKVGLESSQEARFQSVSQSVLNGLNERLIAAEDLQVEALRNEQTETANERLAAESSMLQDEAIEQTKKYSADAGRIASLKMQIAAMKLDALPPPTAPKGYWSDIQTSRQSELTKLLETYNEKLAQVFERRDQLISAESARVKQSVQDQVVAAQAAADEVRRQNLMIAEQRFVKEQRDLNAEDTQVLDEAQAVVTFQRDSLSSPENVSNFGVFLPSEQDGSHLTLVQDRLLLQQRIRAAAEYTVKYASNKMHINLVKSRKGVANLTPLFVQAVKSQSWKVT